MNKEKIRGALGLCRRAGKLTVGSYLVVEALRAGKAALVLLAEDAAANTEKKVLPVAEACGIRAERIPLTKKELGALLSRETGATCVAVSHDIVNLVLTSM